MPATRTFVGYSKGMKRMLTLPAGMIHQPPVPFLDEPTGGIDVTMSRHRKLRPLPASPVSPVT
jgi:ABC-2 type transport system ATP-binding protein